MRETAGERWGRLGESNPRTCSLQEAVPRLIWAPTSDNSCTFHTFGCTSGTVGPEFAPRLIPRRSGRKHAGPDDVSQAAAEHIVDGAAAPLLRAWLVAAHGESVATSGQPDTTRRALRHCQRGTIAFLRGG